MVTDIIIMAGGFGERLWPASSAKMPKQFMTLTKNSSFLQESIKRALSIKQCGKIVIVTRKDIEEECTRQCKYLAETLSSGEKDKILNDVIVLAEPKGKHTSAAIMTGVILLNKLSTNSQHLILVLTSDHVIEPLNLFKKDCKTALKAASDNNFVCFIVPPTEPAVGYGYIKTSVDLYGDENVFKIDQFEEKPDMNTAIQYFQSGNYYWNSGMFAFKSDFFINEMENCSPEVYNSFINMMKGSNPIMTKLNNITILKNWPELLNTYDLVPSIAVDKSIAEKTKHAVAVKSHFNWTDVGSWDTFSELCSDPQNQKVVEVESKNNFVYSDIPVALCGVEDLIVVEKNNQLLIMKKGSSNLVRDAVNKIKE